MLCQAAICSRWHQDNQQTAVNYLDGRDSMRGGDPARGEPSQLPALPASVLVLTSPND